MVANHNVTLHPIASLMLRLSGIALSVFASAGSLQAAEKVVINGSDTLGAKLVPQLAESFKASRCTEGRKIAFEIKVQGSATGIASVIDGTVEIGMSSREAKEKELAKARSMGVDMEAITVAKDGIAVIVNEANPIDSLSSDELEMVFSGDILEWSSLGTLRGRISAYTRGTSSGTYDVFQEMALYSRDYGVDTQKMAGNEQIAAEVGKNLNGIGYVGLAYTHAPGVKVLRIDGRLPGEPDYPLARPLYYLVDSNRGLSPAAEQFIRFTLSPEGQAVVTRVHFLPAR